MSRTSEPVLPSFAMGATNVMIHTTGQTRYSHHPKAVAFAAQFSVQP